VEDGLGPLFDEASFQNHKHGIEVDAQGNPTISNLLMEFIDMARFFMPHNFIALGCNIYYKKITTFQKVNLIKVFTLTKGYVHCDKTFGA
jgi:hypothetical protein